MHISLVILIARDLHLGIRSLLEGELQKCDDLSTRKVKDIATTKAMKEML